MKAALDAGADASAPLPEVLSLRGVTTADLSTPRSRVLLKTIHLAVLSVMAADPLLCADVRLPRTHRRPARPSSAPSGTLATIRHAIDETVAVSPRPLHLAALYCRPEAVAPLASRGGDPNGQDGRGLRPLHYATCAPVVGALVKAGADSSAAGFNGLAPLHVAVDVSVAQELLDRGAKLEGTDDCGNTPLHTAEWLAAVRTPVLSLGVGEGGTGSERLDGVMQRADGGLQRAQQRLLAKILPSLDVAGFLKSRGADAGRRSGGGHLPAEIRRALAEQMSSGDPD